MNVFLILISITVIAFGVQYYRWRQMGKSLRSRVRKLLWKVLYCMGHVSHLLGQHRIQLREVDLEFEQGSFRDDVDGLNFVQISDIHFQKGNSYNNKILMKAVDVINGICPKPLFLFITGDLTDRFNPTVAEKLSKILSKIDVEEKYLVYGSHDVIYPLETTKSEISKVYQSAGLQPLDNTSTTIGPVRVIGVGSFLRNDTKTPEILPNTGHFNICLAHNPDSVKVIEKKIEVDLFLSGHTHNGQVVVPIVRMPVLVLMDSILRKVGIKVKMLNRVHRVVKDWNIAHGISKTKDGLLYVNAGLGAHCNLRAFNRPEITLFKVKLVPTK